MILDLENISSHFSKLVQQKQDLITESHWMINENQANTAQLKCTQCLLPCKPLCKNILNRSQQNLQCSLGLGLQFHLHDNSIAAKNQLPKEYAECINFFFFEFFNTNCSVLRIGLGG